MKNNIGAAMAGGNPVNGRNENDFYGTPPECTAALLEIEAPYIRSHTNDVWECACGEGQMSEIIESFSFGVRSSDLIDRGYGAQLDFFSVDVRQSCAIITNPPFNLAPQFIQHALGTLRVPYLALLLKSTFWHARRRYDLFIEHQPAVIYPMTWRPDFMKRGAPTMDCSWVVWDFDRHPGTQYIPLLKPY